MTGEKAWIPVVTGMTEEKDRMTERGKTGMTETKKTK